MVLVKICGLVLGSPYLYDRDEIFYKREHKHHLKKDGVESIVREHESKKHLNLVVANQMKQLISSNKIFVIMRVKEQYKNQHDFCSSYASRLINSLIKEVETFLVLFKETKHLTHKLGIQLELQLMPKAPLPNVIMNQFSPRLEVNSYRDVGQYWGKSVLKFSCIVSPFHVTNGLEASFQVERKPICFHIKVFSEAMSKNSIPLRETYALVESANQWKHHLMNKEKVTQTNQWPFQ